MNRVTYCINCGEKVEYEVKTRPVAICVNGFLFDAIECYAVCTKCGEEVYAPEVNDANARIRKLYGGNE